jgi:hypothetical protein
MNHPLVEADFGSSWDNHEDVITRCTVNVETGRVFNIVETDLAPTGTLDYTFVRYDTGEVENVVLDHDEYFGDCDQYYLEAKIDEARAAEDNPELIARMAEQVERKRAKVVLELNEIEAREILLALRDRYVTCYANEKDRRAILDNVMNQLNGLTSTIGIRWK